MACWIPSPYQEAFAPGLRIKRLREEAEAKLAVAEKKARRRKPKTEAAEVGD